jgi:serine/threonine-protein kinase RsbW
VVLFKQLFQDLLLMSNVSYLKRVKLEVKNELEALPKVLQWFEKNVHSFFPEKFCWEAQVALAEGFTNAVRHAHRHLSRNLIIPLELTIFADHLEIKIWDFGQPFNFDEKLQLLREKNRDSWEREGGRGLDFMAKLTNEVQYIRVNNQQNCLIMRKFID